MKSKTILSILLFLVGRKAAPQELLANGGFEDENICTEYKVNCAPEAWVCNSSGFDNYYKDPGKAHQGSHCMAIEAGHARIPYQRNFIRSQLLCTLKKGKQYLLEFFIKSPHYILDSIGVYFGPIDPLLERKPIHKLAPSLFLADNIENKFAKDSSWQKVVLIYTAGGEESYITIANFSRNDITGPTGYPKQNYFPVYLDDVSLIPVDKSEKLCPDWQQTKDALYEQNERHEYLQRVIKFKSNRPSLEIPAPAIISRIDTLILPDLLFSTGKAGLQNENIGSLDSFILKYGQGQPDSIVIEGHTDNRGSIQLNHQLSIARAVTVANYIRKHSGNKQLLIITRGWDSQRPVVDNATPAGRQRNRRVVVLLYTRE